MEVQLRNYQILPPFNDAMEFENFIVSLFNSIYKTESFTRFGRSGQEQFGLDVYSVEMHSIIQCKLKVIDSKDDNKIRLSLIKGLKDDLTKFRTYNESCGNKFNKFILASTFKKDAFIDMECINQSNNNLKVEYWPWNRLIPYVTKAINKVYFPNFINKIYDYYMFSNGKSKIEIDKSTSVLDQLYQYILLRYQDINFVPVRLLVNNFPFQSNDNIPLYYNVFNLSIDNENLFGLLNSIEIKEDKVVFKNESFINDVEKYEDKMTVILQKLSHNLIFSFTNGVDYKTVNTRLLNTDQCDCFHCSFNKFKFSEAFLKIEVLGDKECDLKIAYGFYRLGNYISSAKVLLKVADSSLMEGNRTTNFIATFNLIKLKGFIKNTSWNHPDFNEIIDSIDQLDIDESFYRNKLNENRNILKWIEDESFYTVHLDRITEIVKNIRSDYFNHINGGKNSNNNAWELINEFAQMESFISSNFIVFNEFSNFLNAFNTFWEGILISFSFPSTHRGRLDKLDAWMINLVIFYGNPEHTQSIFNRYRLNKISFEYKDRGNATITSFLKGILEDYPVSLYLAVEKGGVDNRFIDKMDKVINNIISLSSILDLNRSDANEIAEYFILFFTSNNLSNRDFKYFRFFIVRHGSNFSKEILNRFLDLAITKEIYQNVEYFESLSNAITFNEKLLITLSQYKKIKTVAFEGNTRSEEIIVHLYRITNNKTIREKIKADITTRLTTSFNTSLCYLAVFYEIIEFRDSYLKQFISKSIFKPDTNHHSFFSLSDFNRYYKFDMLIDICYKNNIDLKSNDVLPKNRSSVN